MNRDKEILRCDFYLRTKYPHLNTRILKLKNGSYTIYANNFPQPFSTFEKEFHYSIKPITTPVLLTETIPEDFEKEIFPLKDDEIVSDYSGMPLTIWQLQRLLQYKFLDIDIVLVDEDNQSRQILLYIRIMKNPVCRKKLEDFINSLELNIPVKIIEDNTEIDSALSKEKERKEKTKSLIQKNLDLQNFDNQISNPVLNMLPISKQDLDKKAEVRDEELFFDRLEDIYKGKINKTDIAKITDSSLNCYIDYVMSGCSNVNIRNGIVLYDKVFIDLPIDKTIEDFCNEQKVKQKELLELCNDGKVNLILTHPSFQYDKKFLDDIYSVAPDSIITRRTLSSLIIADLVEINKNYFINTVDGLLENTFELANLIADSLNKDKDEIYHFLTWPQMALRSSFETLLFNAPKRIASFGINNTFPDFSKLFDKEKGENIEFDFMANADKVHIASALNSVYFPFHEKYGKYTNRPTTSLMADRLNFYKNATLNKGKEYFDIRSKILSGEQNMTPIDLIDINEYIPIGELKSISDCFFTSSQFNSIFSFLSKLDTTERIKTIKKYNELVEKEINKNKKNKIGTDFAINGALDGIGCFIPFLGSLSTLLKFGSEKLGINKEMRKKWEKTQSIIHNGVYDEKQAISFLAKINPVARLNVYN